MSKQAKLTFSPLQFKLVFFGSMSCGVVIGLSVALLVLGVTQ